MAKGDDKSESETRMKVRMGRKQDPGGNWGCCIDNKGGCLLPVVDPWASFLQRGMHMGGSGMNCVNPIALDTVDEDGGPIIVCGGWPCL